MQPQSFTMIGAGSVATHFARALCQAGLRPVQVYSRTHASAQALAEQLGATPVTDLSAVDDTADIYVVALSDNAIPPTAQLLCPQHNGKLFVHTSGSVPLSVFKGVASRCGVLYPLQTLSRQRSISMSQVPLFVEAVGDDTRNTLFCLAENMGARQVEYASSEQRRELHLSAVFAANFTNHCYHIAQQLMQKDGYDFSLLRPLIHETANKINILTPAEAQTGPASRNDTDTMQRHLHMLADSPKLQHIYTMLSDNIQALRMHAAKPVPTAE